MKKWRDIKICRACVCMYRDQIKLTEPSQILDTSQRRLPVRDGGVHIMLHALLIDAEAFKRQIPTRAVMRLHGTRQEERALEVEILDAALHDRQLERDDAGHLDGAAEGDFAVALREVEVAYAEFCSGHVDGEEDFAATAQVLDVTVAAVLGAAGDGPRALLSHFVLQLPGRGASVDILRLRRLGDDSLELGGADEMRFATVPLGQDFGGGSAAEDARMYETGESQMRDVAGGAEDAFKVPYGFGAET